ARMSEVRPAASRAIQGIVTLTSPVGHNVNNGGTSSGDSCVDVRGCRAVRCGRGQGRRDGGGHRCAGGSRWVGATRGGAAGARTSASDGRPCAERENREDEAAR